MLTATNEKQKRTIKTEMEALHAVAAEIEEQINQLGAKLMPLMPPELVSDAEVPGCQRPTTGEHMASLMDLGDRLRSIRATLFGMRERLEI